MMMIMMTTMNVYIARSAVPKLCDLLRGVCSQSVRTADISACLSCLLHCEFIVNIVVTFWQINE